MHRSLPTLQDTYRHKGMRKRLIKTLRKEGITNEEVLDAFDKVPRHYFMDSAFSEKAYQNEAFPIGNGQTISQPYTVCVQTILLEVKKGNKVLEIGTGSGFQAAILAELGARVFSIERQKDLYLSAKDLLGHMGYDSIQLFYQDGNFGLPEFAPFDKIIVTAGMQSIPKNLLGQLSIGGICVAPIGDKVQTMWRIRRVGLNEFEKKKFGQFRFVPFLSGVRD